MTDSKETNVSTITAKDVVDYLCDNPKFLQENPHACDFLTPPKNDDKKIADFQSFMIKRLKDDKEKVIETTQTIVENVRSNMNNQQRIQKVILRILEAKNFEEFMHIITIDLSAMLDTDISVLVVESNGNDIPNIMAGGVRVLPEGTIDKWMNGSRVLLQSNINGIEAIYGGGATLVQSQALLRVDISMDTPPAILAFGSRDPMMFDNAQATDLVDFLARVVERAFRSWLNLEK
jgi:uncharacterized protein YigA (DUF484 family)